MYHPLPKKALGTSWKMLGSCRVCRDHVGFLLDSCWDGNLVFFNVLEVAGYCWETLVFVGSMYENAGYSWKVKALHVGNHWTILENVGSMLESIGKVWI